MLDIVTWLWRGNPQYHSQFTAEHVNILGRMLGRNMRMPFRLSCITDMPEGIDSSIRIIPLWPSPNIETHPGRPNCFRRLKMFSHEMHDLIGPRFASMDLDCVITSEVTPIFQRQEDFIMWGDTARNTSYNGSLVLMNAGARAQVWSQFDPRKAKAAISAAQIVGSDQAWISLVLGPDEKKFGLRDGVYSYRQHILRLNLTQLPGDCRIVFFHGREDPDHPRPQTNAWVREHYR